MDRSVFAIAVENARNVKLGRMSTSHAGQASCPDSCAFKAPAPGDKVGKCYANYGRQAFTTQRLNRAQGETTPADIAHAEAAAIDKLSGRRDMRMHVVGDATTDECALILAAAAGRYIAKHGRRVFTYTHSWRVIARASWGPISVLASCETYQDILAAESRGYAAAIVLETRPTNKAIKLPGGRRIIPCPADMSENHAVTCADCRLCMRADMLTEKKLVIGFAPKHGAGAVVSDVKVRANHGAR